MNFTNEQLATLFETEDLGLGTDAHGIWHHTVMSRTFEQAVEHELRERIAAEHYGDYLYSIARYHSIPVMDREIDRFLAQLPQGALILDIGGCWGWHWRRLAATRPDVGVLIIDFVRANLGHARKLLGPLIGTQVALMHADAMTLPFPEPGSDFEGFDGVWTVQVFQHIPDFAQVCREAYRVLKPGGRFTNHSLHKTPLNRMVYWLLRKHYHLDGIRKDQFHLSRANDSQRRILNEIFVDGRDRYTECLFHPDMKCPWSGRLGSILGAFDAWLSDLPWLGRWVARQRGFEGIKA